ncbi:antibiotic biosynthesis monooxygenase family protein [Agarivorans sp. QJM3NY_33]|uniref:antibiotic biosynthesis monooxygenase family protein n=1 Tax=Agarivorans sp. QJM3NY_33 TaxID=3421432 RepID=UPI003D7DB331
MFIAVYEFEIKEGTEASFREAWLEVTKVIYQHCGSFGSRLHLSDKPNVLVGYAQWPSREQWEKDHKLTGLLYENAREEMRNCLVQSRTVYKLEVSDDYLQTTLASEYEQKITTK